MFQDLTEKFDHVIRKLKGHGKLSEKNISETMREIRRVLLEADVNYKVAKNFIKDVEQRALGQDVIKSITPGQLVVIEIDEGQVRKIAEALRDTPGKLVEINHVMQHATHVPMLAGDASGKLVAVKKEILEVAQIAKACRHVAGDLVCMDVELLQAAQIAKT